MTKLQSRTAKLDSDLLILVKGLDGLVLLQDAYVANPQQGDAEKVYDGIVSSKRDQLVLHLQEEYYKIQIDAVGDVVKGIRF
jgi:hypothetical protein